MKKLMLYVAVFMVLLAPSAFADTLAGGGSWQSAVVSSSNGHTFWDNRSWDQPANEQNVGFHLPGNLPYLGIGTSAVPSFYFQSTGTVVDVVLTTEVTAYINDNIFGYYLLSDKILNPLFMGDQSPLTAVSFTPIGDYGFYLTSPSGTWTTIQGGGNHFAAFQKSVPGAEIYWMGIEDLPLDASDADYNDMIVKISYRTPVPEPATLLFLGLGLVGLSGFSKFRSRQ